MKGLKEKILEDNHLPTPSPTDRSTPSTPSSTGNPRPSILSHATGSNDIYVYGVGILAVLAIGVCIFFAYNTFQLKIRKLTNDRSTALHEQKKDQPPKRRPMI